MAASVEEFVELLSSEQHVDIAKLRHLARHGVHPAVRGEVWMYLLGVLSSDKSQEMTSVRALYNTYDGLLSAQQRSRNFPPELTEHINLEAERVWRNRIPHETQQTPHPGHTSQSKSSGLIPGWTTATRSKLALPSSYGNQTTDVEESFKPVAPMKLDALPRLAGRSEMQDHTTLGETQLQDNGRVDVQRPQPMNAERRGKDRDSSQGIENRQPLLLHGGRKTPASRRSSSEASDAASARNGQAFPSASQTDEEERKRQFVSRMHNIVSIWIERKALSIQQSRKSQSQASAVTTKIAQPSVSERPESAAAGTSAPNASSIFSASPSSSSSALQAPSELSVRVASPTSQPLSRTDVVQTVPPSAAAAGEGEDVTDMPDGQEEEEEEAPFDPAMGMGIEDDASDYMEDLADRDFWDRRGASSRYSNGPSQTTAKVQLESDDEDELNKDRGEADNLIEDVAGLGISGRPNAFVTGSSPSPSDSWRSSSRGLPGRPRTPQLDAGYGSARRSRSQLLSPSTRSLSSRSTSEEDESDEGGVGEDNRELNDRRGKVDEELRSIQLSLWRPCLVQMASPFVFISGKKRVEAGVFFAFEKLMSRTESDRAECPLSHLLATFHSLLRRTIPDLRAYFDDEGLDITPFVKGWLESLFSGQMKLSEHGCLRLWDAYFSATPSTTTPSQSDPTTAVTSSSPLSLNLYVCLAILLHCKDMLEELDRSECESFLRALPDLEVEKILNEAANLRLSHRQAILVGGEGEGDVETGPREDVVGAKTSRHWQGAFDGQTDETEDITVKSARGEWSGSRDVDEASDDDEVVSEADEDSGSQGSDTRST